MDSIFAQDGDTWESLAAANSVPLSSLLSANGLDPNSAPDPPATGSAILLPDDPPDVCVAPGHDHALDTGGDATLWVRLDMSPDEAMADGGSLRLYSTDGTHDVTLTLAGNAVSNGETVDILFDSVDRNDVFSIDYIDQAGNAVTLVEAKAFSDLQDPNFSGESAPDSSGPDSQ